MLATIEDYRAHEFTIGDIDPWRAMEYRNRPAPDARQVHPCVLPRPPLLQGISLEGLATHVPTACRQGWKVDGNFYYLPPRDYSPLEVSSDRWRAARAFPYRRHPVSRKAGYLDDLDQIWHWHEQERHWDVQLEDGSHIPISHDGRAV